MGGKNFDVPGLEPAQPFLRKLNPQYKPGDNKTSQFELYPVTYGGIAYWCLYDLLGRFMSLISLAPKEATRDNFYMPMANMYREWCVAIGEEPPHIMVPWTFACVWVRNKDGENRFFLGASLGGYRPPGSVNK